MRKLFILLLILLIVLPSATALNLDIEKLSSKEVMVAGINEPAVFEIRVTNNGDQDNLRFDNLLGFRMFPIGTIPIKSGEEKTIKLMIYPREDFSYRGFYNFKYFITGQDMTQVSDELTVKIIDLKDAFEIGSGEVDFDSNSIDIYIHNRENFDFKSLSVKFSSPFFSIEKNFSLGPNERKDFKIQLDKNSFKKLTAGFYTLNAEIVADGKKAYLEGVIKFSERDLLSTTKKNYGIIVNTQIIEKVNEGNVVEKSEVNLKKNIISRLFTSFSPEPDVVERQGMVVYYTWKRDIRPGESLKIIVKTNWLFPALIMLFIIAVVILAKQYSKTDLVLRKKVSFVKAKGGEFALKVSIFIHAKKYVERISIIDRLPPLVKIYGRFGGKEPLRVNEKNRKIEWEFESLESGETRVLSYIIYSKIGVLGKFALPTATALYEREGRIRESESNRAFFVAEQKEKDTEEQ